MNFPEWKRRWNGKRRFQRRSLPLSCKKDFLVKILLFILRGQSARAQSFLLVFLYGKMVRQIFYAILCACVLIFFKLCGFSFLTLCAFFGGRRGEGGRKRDGGGFFCIVVVVKTAAAFLFHFCFFCKAIYV